MRRARPAYSRFAGSTNTVAAALPFMRPFQRGLRFLTRFAVGTRYPRQAVAALRWERRVRVEVRRLLGLRI